MPLRAVPRLALLLAVSLAACGGPRGGDIVEDLLTGERREILAAGRCREMGTAVDAPDADARCYRYVSSAVPGERVAPLAELDGRRWDRIN